MPGSGTYALPAAPTLALLGAAAFMRRVGPQAAPRWLAAGLALTLLAGLVGVLELQRGGDMDRRSAKGLVAHWMQGGGRLDGSGGPALVFVGPRQFSAQFYSHGQARRVDRAEDVAALLPAGSDGAWVALGEGHEHEPPEAPRLGRHGHYLVVRLKRP